ncbi:MAG: dTDP-4-dehydrorhamnose reductase [Phormidesmis sp.]
MSKPKTILLFGAAGQIGQELAETLAPLGNVAAIDRSQLDLSDLSAIAQTIKTIQPHIIVNAAAYTAVDRAESEAALADCINAQAPEEMAKAAADGGAMLVHISTDYVFSGQVGSPRTETDSTGPLSVYGQTKLAGEQAIRTVLKRHIILRTSWVYGTYGKGNFLKTMLRLGREREALSVVADQVGAPTWAKEVADAIASLLQKPNTFGTYHFTNSGVASWYDFALAIFEEAEALGLPLKLRVVKPITTADYPTPAQRPAYSVLNNQKIAALLERDAPHWRTSLRAMLKQYASAERLKSFNL